MPVRLDTAAADFPAAFAALLADKRETEEDVAAAVAGIIADVRARGDAALIDYTHRFDRLDLRPDQMAITAAEIAEAEAACPPAALAALHVAAARIEAYHRAHAPQSLDWIDDTGTRLGLVWKPVPAVGLYVPGGTAAYPSSVLMNALPARVAGVPRRVMVTPTPDGRINPLVLAAARIAGITEIWRIGGAQAVAALAYGTARIQAVDKIVGPGNAYVAAAKRQVFGRVGIDSIAGPSEVLIIADSSADPAWLAADLLAQAEHDPAAQSILMSADSALLDAVATAVTAQLATLPRADIAGASWRDHGALIHLAGGLDEAPPLIDQIAPEHLQLAIRDPDPLAARVANAGAIFLGALTPEAIGDYVGGPNHVLPTARTARYASGLSVHDFMKRTTLLGCSAQSLAALGPTAVTLARAEGLDAHGNSIALRLEHPRP